MSDNRQHNVQSEAVTNSNKIRLSDLGISILIIVFVWQIIVWATGAPHYILPGPLLVMQAMFTHAGLIAEHSLVTAMEVIFGLILGTIFGVLTALYLMMSPTAKRFGMPILVLSQTVPVFALAPILTLWFGYGLGSKIAMTILIIYFPVASTFFDGLRGTPRGFLDLAQSMRASPLSTLFHVRVPAALPSFTSGLRLATVYAPIGAVIGEWVGASQGLGYLMLLANGRVKIDLMFAALIALCCLTMLLRAVTGSMCDRINHWAGHGHY
jgi:putative hydroxymethylpyrimidine transport system permease protein